MDTLGLLALLARSTNTLNLFPKLGKASNNIQSIKDLQVPIVHVTKSLVPHFNLLTSGQVTRDEI